MPKTSDKILEILERLEIKIDALQEKIDILETSKHSKKITLKKTPKKSNKKKVVIKNGNVTITKHPNGLIITGDTYEKRGVIKKNGGWWTPDAKGWTVRLNKYDEIKSELKLMSKNLTEKYSDNDLQIEDKISNFETPNEKIEEYEFIDDD
jgi:hypothetical protein